MRDPAQATRSLAVQVVALHELAVTLEANAAMRSIVRRDTGESYEEFLTLNRVCATCCPCRGA
jgi:hypothetical protein